MGSISFFAEWFPFLIEPSSFFLEGAFGEVGFRLTPFRNLFLGYKFSASRECFLFFGETSCVEDFELVGAAFGGAFGAGGVEV